MKIMLKRPVLKIILSALLLLAITACEQEKSQENASPAKPRIALVMKSLANEFFINMAEGAKSHQSKNQDDYELLINGIKDESDLTQQVALVEQMIASQVDAIVIAPADSQALVPVLKRARKAGIVVINIDNKLDKEVLKDVGIKVPFVGPDNREGAREVGDYLAASLSNKDKVAIIGGISTAFNAQQRQLGFEDAMQAAGMTVVSIQSGEWQQARASVVAAALINEHPDLKALLCSNDNMYVATTIWQSVRQQRSGRPAKVMISWWSALITSAPVTTYCVKVACLQPRTSMVLNSLCLVLNTP